MHERVTLAANSIRILLDACLNDASRLRSRPGISSRWYVSLLKEKPSGLSSGRRLQTCF
jgi:hypothetical protein